MPLTPDAAELRAYLETGEAPGPHLDMLTAVGFRVAGAAARLGVFDALAAGPLPAAALAGKTGTDERAMAMLADALVSFNYLTRTPDGYANAPIAQRWLLPTAEGSYLHTLTMWQTLLFELWGNLEQTVRTGRPAVDFYAWLERRPEELTGFSGMLTALAGWLADDILAAAPLPAGAGRLLDLGGGHARHTITFCQRYPELRATVVDLPGALEIGRAAVAREGLADRVTFRAGDLATEPLGEDVDVVLMFNLLHGAGAEQNAALVARAAQALRPGGVVAVLDQLREEEPPKSAVDDAFLQVFNLNLCHTQGGRLYRAAEVDGWLAAAGLTTAGWQRLPKMPASQITVATREA
jgi:SAM-dependent methyltransferase